MTMCNKQLAPHSSQHSVIRVINLDSGRGPAYEACSLSQYAESLMPAKQLHLCVVRLVTTAELLHV